MNSVKEVIILAGGLGTRLRSAVPDLPKCMAPVNDKPFLYYVIRYFQQQGVERFIFSLGYKHEIIEEFLQTTSIKNYTTVIEAEPLGTGGAILKAMHQADAENVFVTNGDTLFKADVNALYELHNKKNSHCTLALKPMQNFNRYGVVMLNDNSSIKSFEEKKLYEYGLINGGLYCINKHHFLQHHLPEKFSFEKDYLEAFQQEHHFFGYISNEYFIDIGIPEDFLKAQTEIV